MFGAHAPPVFLSQSLHELIGHLSAVREGSGDAIHQARVNIRRVREAMTLAGADSDEELNGIEKRLSRAGRALSSARDADVAQQLIERLEARLPLAARTLGHLRVSVTEEQIKARRKAVKKLEALGLESLAQEFAHTSRASVHWSRALWRSALRRHMRVRAAAVRDAVEHAGGIYFPNRVHSARVAIKQLRYTLELADQTGIWRAPRALDLLRKVQDELGKAHDRQIMLARLDAVAESQWKLDPDECQVVRLFIRAEALARHAKYLRSRADILAVCDACMSVGRRGSRSKTALVAAGLAVPSLLLFRRRPMRGKTPDRNEDRVWNGAIARTQTA